MQKLHSLGKFCFSQANRYSKFKDILSKRLNEIKEAGTWKNERVITSPQKHQITSEGRKVLNFCANNYLGLSDNAQIVNAAKKTLDERGFGMSSVRFICGTQDIHKQLEKTISDFYGKEDTILYPSCFDANGGIFESLLGSEDAVISDALNHASIIDGIRLSKAVRYRYKHLDMNDLKEQLKQAQKQRIRLIVTDGVFSMDGDIAPLDKIVQLAKDYDALIMIDECHAAGFLGKNGKGTPELFGVLGEIDIINGTLGKALGGASGGYTAASGEVVKILRQTSRPYLFSNSLAPAIAGASLEVFEILKTQGHLRESLRNNTSLFRTRMKKAGFKLLGHDECPIAPVFLGDARVASIMAEELFKEDIYVIGFSYPVVPKGEARIRVQLNASLSQDDVNKTVDAFIKIGKQLKIIH